MKTLKIALALMCALSAIIVLGGCNKGVGPPTPGTSLDKSKLPPEKDK
jgi:hypothetical protein